ERSRRRRDGRVRPRGHNGAGGRGRCRQRGQRKARARRGRGRRHPPRRRPGAGRRGDAARAHKPGGGRHNRRPRAAEPVRDPHPGTRLRPGPARGGAAGPLLPQRARPCRRERRTLHRLPRHLDRHLRVPGRRCRRRRTAYRTRRVGRLEHRKPRPLRAVRGGGPPGPREGALRDVPGGPGDL
ncbi:MAG: O-acetyl-ADP-ribose deacetylase, partial [uncultured Rubrobacteraceae bacterium]